MTYQKDLLNYANKLNRLWKETLMSQPELEKCSPSLPKEHLERFYDLQSQIEHSRKDIDKRYVDLLAEYEAADTSRRTEMEQKLELLQMRLDETRNAIVSVHPLGGFGHYAASWPTYIKGSCHEVGVRAQVLDVIVRQALAGAPWREICAQSMQANDITIHEVETEIKRRNSVDASDA